MADRRKTRVDTAPTRDEAIRLRDLYLEKLRKLGYVRKFTVGYEEDHTGGRETFTVYLYPRTADEKGKKS